jgi:hypothetical protein
MVNGPHVTTDIAIMRERLAVLETEQACVRENIALVSVDLDRRLDDMDRFRKQILDERGLFLTVATYNENHEAMRQRIESLELAKSNMDGRLWVLGVGFTLINAAISGGLITLLHYVK